MLRYKYFMHRYINKTALCRRESDIYVRIAKARQRFPSSLYRFLFKPISKIVLIV